MELNDIIALLIAFGALLISGLTMMFQRRHNALTVRPLITEHVQITPTLQYTFTGIEISNKGLGPAEIASVKIRYRKDDKEIVSHSWKSILEDAGLWQTWVSYIDFGRGDVLETGETKSLITISENDLKPERKNKMIALMHHMIIIINYKSLYGNTFTYTFMGKKIRRPEQ